jgi:hypothetical protein
MLNDVLSLSVELKGVVLTARQRERAIDEVNMFDCNGAVLGELRRKSGRQKYEMDMKSEGPQGNNQKE